MDMNKLIKEIEVGIKQSIDAVKEKAAMVVEKADELTEEGKKQYRLYELKNKRQKQSAGVGQKLQKLVAEKKVTIPDKALNTLLASLSRTIAEIDRLEGKKQNAPKSRPAGKKTSVKPKAASKKKSAVKQTSQP